MKKPDLKDLDTVLYSPYIGCKNSEKERLTACSNPFISNGELVIFLYGKSGFVSCENCEKVDEIKLYYIPPSQELFNEMRHLCCGVLIGCGCQEDAHHLMTFDNISDNFMTMLACLDGYNQNKVKSCASPELLEAIEQRIASVR